MRAALGLVCALSLAACLQAEYPNGRIACSPDHQCPGELVCDVDSLCWYPGTGPSGAPPTPGLGNDGGLPPFVPDAGVSVDGTLRLTPSNVLIAPGASRTIVAESSLGDAVTFTTTGGGSIDATGRYTAPATPGDYQVIGRTAAGVTATTYVHVENYGLSLLAGALGGMGTADDIGAIARISNAQQLATDELGNVYFTDQTMHTIRRVTPEGVVTTIAGLAGRFGLTDGPCSSARFAYPNGIAYQPGGVLFVADYQNQVIRRIDLSTQQVTTFAGQAGPSGHADGPALSARFAYPSGLALSGSTLYVADTYNYVVRAIALTAGATAGEVITVAGQVGQSGFVDGPIGVARLGTVEALVYDAARNRLYVSDYSSGAHVRVIPLGTGSIGSLTIYASMVSGLALSPDGGRLLYSDRYGNRYIRSSDLATGQTDNVAGVYSTTGGLDGPAATATFSQPLGLAYGPSGDLLIADLTTIRRLANGNVTTLAGSADKSGAFNGVGSSVRFNRPRGVAVAHDGTMFVADESNNAIRKIRRDGSSETFAGALGAQGAYLEAVGLNARFNTPRGMAIDASDVLYVADSGNQVIRKITPDGSSSVFAGTPGQTGNDAHHFYTPNNLAFDNAGNLLVADSFNYSLRRVSANGEIETIYTNPSVWSWDYNPIACDRDGFIYLGLATGVMRLAADGTQLGLVPGIDRAVTALVLDARDTLWITDLNYQLHSLKKNAASPVLVAGTLAQGGVRTGDMPARLNVVAGLAVSPLGELMFTSENSILRLFVDGVTP